ncbi:MAG: hypothetical protein IKE78_02025 [Erysipelotrichaceae bacterium]|jgi:Ca2+/Na+ antiporter|nr:hypothetical protein [Erysipelotrichaceae bacterium]MBR3351140.1 hypothetical protein [Erysipelotrichaceae bacterium]MBR6958836.1 hypothetical protein [Erysipelotrichaceae bacterium]
MNKNRDMIYVILFAVAAFVLFPIIGKIIFYLLIAAAIFFAVMYFRSRKLKKEIEKNPEDYFSQQLYRQREKEPVKTDVIDAEYKEKEIESE